MLLAYSSATLTVGSKGESSAITMVSEIVYRPASDVVARKVEEGSGRLQNGWRNALVARLLEKRDQRFAAGIASDARGRCGLHLSSRPSAPEFMMLDPAFNTPVV